MPAFAYARIDDFTWGNRGASWCRGGGAAGRLFSLVYTVAYMASRLTILLLCRRRTQIPVWQARPLGTQQCRSCWMRTGPGSEAPKYGGTSSLWYAAGAHARVGTGGGPVSGESLVWPAALVLLRFKFGPPNLKDSRVGRDSRRETLPSALPWPFFRLPLAGVEWGVDCIVHVCKLPVWAPRLAFLPLRPPGSAHHGRAGSDRLAESTMTPSRGDCERGAGVTSLA